MRLYGFFVIMCFCLLASCSSSKLIAKTNKDKIGLLKFLGEYIVPNGLMLDSAVIGGLSGIDYDVQRDRYYMVCDDPSTMGPARYFEAQIRMSEKGIDTIIFTRMVPILNPSGMPYADIRRDRGRSADLEAMRYDPSRDELVRSSEGQRVLNATTRLLQNPDVIIMDRDGHFKDSLVLPANMRFQEGDAGPRHNSVFEGIAYNQDYSKVYVSVEDALYEDGYRAGTGDSTAWVRILAFNRNTKQQEAQYAYRVDAVPYAPVPAGAFKVNGISDILYAGNEKLLVIERAWSTGRVPSDVRLYLADMRNATDVSATTSLQSTPPKNPVSKQLLLDLGSLGITIYNIEGATFGPMLPNGHRSLLLVVDNNFNPREKNQFLLFEIIP